MSLAFLLAAFAMPVAAIEKIFIEGVGVVVHENVEIFSVESDDMHAFAGLAAQRMLAYSQATGYEACGIIAKGHGRLGIVITSNHSHIACAVHEDKTPHGMTSTGADIHSHGLGAVKMNRQDMMFSGIRLGARDRHLQGTVYGQNRNRFSAVDLTAGPGYLAAPNGTLYHDGKGQISLIRAGKDAPATARP